MRKTALLRNLIAMLVAMVCPAGMAFAQSQSGANSQAQSQTSTPAPAQPSAQQQPQTPPEPEQKEEFLADAARKARAKKAQSQPAKVYTDENLSGLKGGGISVVGDGNSGAPSSSEAANTNAEPRANVDANSGGSEEARWRGKARPLLDAIAATDAEISKLKEEIAKYGNVGFDPSTGLQRNVIYVDDRNAKVKQLEGHKQDLEKQMDALQEEGRKAGADSAWFR